MALSLTNPQFKKLTATPESRTYTVAVVTIVVIVLLVFFAIRPSIASVFDRLNENEDKREFIAKMEQKQANLVSLTNKETQQAAQLELLDDAFPESRREDEMINVLTALVKSNRLELTSIDMASPEEKPNIDTDLDVNTKHSIITLVVNGERSNIWNLVDDLEKMNRIANLQKIGVSSRIDEQGNTSKVSDAEIVFEIYYYEQP
ncbi:type 4a pilus biogenesis protein PilO [Candidatus Dojkabacteria bacterium]|nr:type 4a pilus biogenesis protein PilO [Candidatus Dojkabacteria bacterium]